MHEFSPQPSAPPQSTSEPLPKVFQRQQWLSLPNRGRRLGRLWWPAGTVQAVMAIVPGLGDHSGRYAPLAMQLCTHGIGVVSMDLQGHGLSPGWRGCIDSYDNLLREVGFLVTWARGGGRLQQLATNADLPTDQVLELANWRCEMPQLAIPVCLYGHSMGGNLVLNAVMRSRAEPDRVIASAPMLRAVHPPGPLFMRIARLLKVLLPHWRLKAPVRKEWLTHLNSEQEAYQHDPLMHRRVSLRLGANLIDSGLWVIDHVQILKTPCLVLHGSEDKITDPLASDELVKRGTMAGAPIQLKSYTGMLHDLHRDQGKAEVIADIAAWSLRGNLYA